MYESAINGLKASRDSGDQVEALKAQYDYCLETLNDPDLTSSDRVRTISTMTSISMKIVDLEGLRRKPREGEEKILDQEEQFRHFFSKDGVGLDTDE